jgi:hypothetical protein
LPGTTSVAQGQRIDVGIGQQVNASNFALVPGRTARVSGTATDSRGRPLVGGSVGISQETVGTEGGMFTSVGGAPVSPDGTFIITNVPPGEYKIRARSAEREPGAAPEIVTQVLTVDGQDIEGLRLSTTAGWSIKGRFRTESGEPLTMPRTRARVTAALLSPELEPRTSGMFTSGQIRDDWTFAVTNIFGPSRLQVTVADQWAVKAVLHGDRDVTDEPLDMNSGEEMSDIEVVLTNRVTRVTGSLSDAKGLPTYDGTVLIFASQPNKWFDQSRWLRSTRPNQKGTFEVVGLPNGEYLAIAVDYVQEGVWNDPEYLASLVRHAVKITLREDEPANARLKVISIAQ